MKISNVMHALRGVYRSSMSSAQMLAEIRLGVANQSNLLNRKFKAVTSTMEAIFERQQAQLTLQRIQIEMMAEVLRGRRSEGKGPPDCDRIAHLLQEAAATEALSKDVVTGNQDGDTLPDTNAVASTSFENAMASMPLMIDAKTYNTAHPKYNARAVRNFPGRILNRYKPSSNPVYVELLKLADGKYVDDGVWTRILSEALAEAKNVPHVEQIFERRDYVESYMGDLQRKYGGHYVPGWVSLNDALFLYWLVRNLKPKTIVQTGVCNGLSASFMVLALVKNGGEGVLRAIDLPPIFDPNDPAWTVAGSVYGVFIPEGKNSGWMVPDAYRDRFVCWNGDAKALLPKLIDEVDTIDMFYHDSDHTYDHMMFEFREAMRKLRPGGLIVGDDISWNASLWDLADEYGVPSFNFKGTVGVAFF